jgi:CBS-domain-containing membrane protein
MGTYRYDNSWRPEAYRGETPRGRDLNRDPRYSERNLLDRASDEVAAWFGDEEADRRRRMDRGGGAPVRTNRSYRRSGQERAHEVMTNRVSTVRPSDPITFAARLMRDEDCGALPVVDRSGRIVGMVTDRDITCRVVADGEDLRFARVGDCMTDEVFAVHVDSSINECMRTMARHQVRRVPVVDDSDRVVGIVSQGDLARHAGEHQHSGERRAVADVVCAVSEPTGQPYR